MTINTVPMTINTVPNSVLPGTFVYAWSDRDAFRSHLLSVGGSGDVHGGRVVATDLDRHLGRYPRDSSRHELDPGRTKSFYCRPRKLNDDSNYLPVVLAGAPWGSNAERDATYAFLATCGCWCNDMTDNEKALARSR